LNLDGQEHPVPGPNVFKTAVYRRTDSRTLEQDGKRVDDSAGKVIWAVSKDGKELHQVTDGTYPNGQRYHTESYYKRAGGHSSEDLFIGKWENEPSRSKFDTPVVYTIRDVEDGLDVGNSTGLAFTAKFDAKEHPTSGAADGSTVTLTRVDERTIRFVVKRKNGGVSRTAVLAVEGGRLNESTETPLPNGAHEIDSCLRSSMRAIAASQSPAHI
jgi:hypothetical protein